MKPVIMQDWDYEPFLDKRRVNRLSTSGSIGCPHLEHFPPKSRPKYELSCGPNVGFSLSSHDSKVLCLSVSMFLVHWVCKQGWHLIFCFTMRWLSHSCFGVFCNGRKHSEVGKHREKITEKNNLS